MNNSSSFLNSNSPLYLSTSSSTSSSSNSCNANGNNNTSSSQSSRSNNDSIQSSSALLGNHSNQFSPTNQQSLSSSNITPDFSSNLSNFMSYNPFAGNANISGSDVVSSLYNNPVVSMSTMVNTIANGSAQGTDHRTSSIAALRLKAREHSVALGTI